MGSRGEMEDAEATKLDVEDVEDVEEPESVEIWGRARSDESDPGRRIHPDGAGESKENASSWQGTATDARGCRITLSKFVPTVVRQSCTAIFGEEPHATDAFNEVVKRYWVAGIFLIVATLVKVLDTVSDVLVTVDWWRNDGQVNSRRSYARFSVGILAVSTFVSLMFSFVGAGDLESWGSRIIVILFSLFDLSVVPWAELLWLDVWSGGMQPEDVFGTEDMDFSRGNTGPKCYWKLMKALEFILEAAPEITLQSYVAAFEFFDDDKAPSVLLQLSITVSVLSIAAGVSTTYLCYETLKAQIWGACFFAGALIARIAICAFAFVEFGRFAMIFVAIIVVLRLGIFAHMSGWSDGFCKETCFSPLALLLTLPSLVNEMIVPLGFRNISDDAENTVFWGSFNPWNGIFNAATIAIFGHDSDTQGVRSRLESPLAFIMIALHVVENLIMLVIIAAIPHRAQRAQVGTVPLVAFVVVPMLVEATSYLMVHVTTKVLEAKWTAAIEAIAIRLKRGLPPLPAGFKDMGTVLEGLFYVPFGFRDREPTVAKCEKLKERIQNGNLDNLTARRALDLLLLGRARLRAERIKAVNESVWYTID